MNIYIILFHIFLLCSCFQWKWHWLNLKGEEVFQDSINIGFRQSGDGENRPTGTAIATTLLHIIR